MRKNEKGSLAVARSIIGPDDTVLITGSNGFIGSRVVNALLGRGFTHLRCLVRPSSDLTALKKVLAAHDEANASIIEGNLLSREDCERITADAAVILHLAAGRGVKSYPDAYLNSVVATRNLLDAAVKDQGLKRLVSVSSFSVYSNKSIKRRGLLDESCEEESRPAARGDAYTFAKVNQDRLIREYEQRHRLPVVILRPGVVYGPGNKGIHGRIGIGTFGEGTIDTEQTAPPGNIITGSMNPVCQTWKAWPIAMVIDWAYLMNSGCFPPTFTVPNRAGPLMDGGPRRQPGTPMPTGPLIMMLANFAPECHWPKPWPIESAQASISPSTSLPILLAQSTW